MDTLDAAKVATHNFSLILIIYYSSSSSSDTFVVRTMNRLNRRHWWNCENSWPSRWGFIKLGSWNLGMGVVLLNRRETKVCLSLGPKNQKIKNKKSKPQFVWSHPYRCQTKPTEMRGVGQMSHSLEPDFYIVWVHFSFVTQFNCW